MPDRWAQTSTTQKRADHHHCVVWVGSWPKVAGVPEPRLVVARSCDIADTPQAVLVRRARKIGCVHSDVAEAMADEVATFVNTIEPHFHEPSASKREAYLAMQDYLVENSELAFRPERSAFCLGKRFENEHPPPTHDMMVRVPGTKLVYPPRAPPLEVKMTKPKFSQRDPNLSFFRILVGNVGNCWHLGLRRFAQLLENFANAIFSEKVVGIFSVLRLQCTNYSITLYSLLEVIPL